MFCIKTYCNFVVHHSNIDRIISQCFCSFLFLFMENDRNAGFIFPAPKYLLGLTNTVGYLLGIPLLFFSSQLISIFGHENLVAFGLLCFAGRFLSYSFAYNPFEILPIEIFTAVTGMIIVIGPQFAMKTNRKYLATLVALFGAVNFGLGGHILFIKILRKSKR